MTTITPPPPNPTPVNPTPAAPTRDPRFSDAFSAGWLIAQLHGPITDANNTSADALPTAKELGRYDRGLLALTELKTVLEGTLGPALQPDHDDISASLATVQAAWTPDTLDVAELRSALEQLHRKLLIRLTVADHRLGSSYSLGRSLSDTCWLPNSLADFGRKFNKYRIGTLQGWLTDLPIGLPQSAAVVAQGLGHWTDWLDVNHTLNWAQDGSTVQRAMKIQGEHWRALLAGEKPPCGCRKLIRAC